MYLSRQPFRSHPGTISQLMTIHDKLPDDFIEKMGECKDQNLIKRFSGKQLFKIAGLKNEHNRRETLKSLSAAL